MSSAGAQFFFEIATEALAQNNYCNFGMVKIDKGRMEAFSDGALAIIIAILMLELTVPQEVDLAALPPLTLVFLSHVLSPVFLGVYWNYHHHLLQAIDHVDGRVLWANLHLLF